MPEIDIKNTASPILYTGVQERIAVIGGSLSGKSQYVLDYIVPKFMYIHLFGAEHNFGPYKKASNKHARVKYHANKEDLIKIKGSNKVQQLVILDDFIDVKYMGSDDGKKLFTQSRHSNYSVVMIAHAPNVVLTPLAKTSISIFVLCQYIPSDQFNELLETFWFPMLQQDLLIDDIKEGKEAEDPTKLMKRVRIKASKILNDTFKYKYSKLVIYYNDRKWRVIIPDNKEEAECTNGAPKNSVI